MITRMLTSALIAGFAAGLLAALLHFAFIQNLILLGEGYESGALVHFAAAAPGDGTAAGHDHATGPGTGPAHSHAGGAAGEAAPPALLRNGLTVLFTALTYSAFGLLLVAGFGLAGHFGHPVAARDGVLWGLAGFAALQLAPAMGLAPELPGSLGADLQARQLWYLATEAATAAGLGLLFFGRGLAPMLAAVALIGAPHLIGAPQPGGFSGVAPPELAAEFSARVLGVGLIAWAVLGIVAARIWASPPA